MEKINSECISNQNWAKSFLDFEEWSVSPKFLDLSVKTKLPLNSMEGRLTLDISVKIYTYLHFSNTCYTLYEKAACHMA